MLMRIMTPGILILSGCLLFCFVSPAQTDSNSNDGLKRLLQRYPNADLDGDGILTQEEARKFRTQIWQEETEAGEPIDKTNNEAPPVIKRHGDPYFSGVAYGVLKGQSFDLWLPRGVPLPCPAVFCLAAEKKDDIAPSALIEACLEANLAIGIIHPREESGSDLYCEDLAMALKFLSERSVAYGFKADALGLFASGQDAEYALYGSLLAVESRTGLVGVKCAALLDAQPQKASEDTPATEVYLSALVPQTAAVLKKEHNAPVITLFQPRDKAADQLYRALEAQGVKTTLYSAAEGETELHLLRMTALFFKEALAIQTPPADTAAEPVATDTAVEPAPVTGESSPGPSENK